MRQSVSHFVAGFFIIAICVGSAANSQDVASFKQNANADDKAAEKTILSTFQKQVKAWNEGDLEKFMETYWKSPDLTFSAGGKTTRGWQATLDRYKKSYTTREKMGKLTFTEFELTFLGNTGALALGRWHLKLKDGDREGNFSVVLRKIKGQWLIIHDHSSSLEKEDK